MAVTVRIPTALRKLAGGNDRIEVSAATVGEALDGVKSSHPELAAQLVGDDGAVRRFVNLFANDEDIRFLENLETPLTDGDELSIVPAIAGGR